MVCSSRAVSHLAHRREGTVDYGSTRAFARSLLVETVAGQEAAPARSSASTKRPATSNPVCCAISTKQVGLVTLTSVK